MEHIEEAGIHSGDSACSLPAHSLASSILVRLEKQTRDLALALKVVGLMNVQYAVKGREIYILEVNPRASRTVPFVAKVIGKPIAGIAARIMNGEPLAAFNLKSGKLAHVAVKEAVFPFARFPGRRHHPGARDALDRRGHGHRPRLTPWPSPRASSARATCCRAGHGVRVGAGRRQGGHPRGHARSCRPRLPHPRHARHAAGHWQPTASPASRSTRCWKGARTSST